MFLSSHFKMDAYERTGLSHLFLMKVPNIMVTMNRTPVLNIGLGLHKGKSWKRWAGSPFPRRQTAGATIKMRNNHASAK